MDKILRIGARGSPLSLAQTGLMRDRLAALAGAAFSDVIILPVTTTGDRIQDRALSEAGGKGLFTKELDEALLDGRIDLAVHSAKDLPTALPNGVVLAATPEREDPRDALICWVGSSLADLPRGARLGTASLRRQAQALFVRPDLNVFPLRGNVATRIAKLEAGELDATFLAVAGLKRLGMAARISAFIDPAETPPAACQGTLAITTRAGDERLLSLLAALEDPSARMETEAERAVLEALDGSCRTPIGAFARFENDTLTLTAETLTIDGKRRWRRAGALAAPTQASARALGREIGEAIKNDAGEFRHEA